MKKLAMCAVPFLGLCTTPLVLHAGPVTMLCPSSVVCEGDPKSPGEYCCSNPGAPGVIPVSQCGTTFEITTAPLEAAGLAKGQYYCVYGLPMPYKLMSIPANLVPQTDCGGQSPCYWNQPKPGICESNPIGVLNPAACPFVTSG